jgi:hypothetical protein
MFGVHNCQNYGSALINGSAVPANSKGRFLFQYPAAESKNTIGPLVSNLKESTSMIAAIRRNGSTAVCLS